MGNILQLRKTVYIIIIKYEGINNSKNKEINETNQRWFITFLTPC